MQDGRAHLGTDHRVVGVLEHDQAIAEPDRQGSAAASLADPDRHHGDPHSGERRETRGDGPRLPPVLVLETGIGAGGVEEGHDREAEAVGEEHDALGFPEALGMRRAEVVADVLGRVAALAVTEHCDLPRPETGEPREHGGVVAVEPVTVQLDHIAEDVSEVVVGVGALRVPGDLHALPGRQRRVERRAQFVDLGLERGDLHRELGPLHDGEMLQRLELLLQVDERPLELHHEPAGHVTHRPPPGRRAAR